MRSIVTSKNVSWPRLIWPTVYNVSQKKLDPFSFEDNFYKYCPILIILSLLQTEINYDQVYPKIYHHTSNLLVYWPASLA